MKSIEPFDSTPIVDEKKMANQHKKLVDSLKKSLLIGQVGFIQAGQYLYEIQKGDTYKYEDSAHIHTFKDFCERPDIPIPGRTPESRRRTAYTLIKVYEQIQLNHGIKETRLAPIGWTKLGIVAQVLEKEDDEDVEEWLTKAEELTALDLSLEAGTTSKSLSDLQNCSHDNIKKVSIYRCPDCKNSWAKDPNV